MSNRTHQSPRQEVGWFADTGRLRDVAHDAGLSSEACDLLVRVVQRYTEPRRRRPNPLRRKRPPSVT